MKSYWKGEMDIKDQNSNFVSLHSSPNCMDQNARLCIEVVDEIGRKQINLLSENQVVKKLLKKLWDEEATLKNLAFSFIFYWLLCPELKAVILQW